MRYFAVVMACCVAFVVGAMVFDQPQKPPPQQPQQPACPPEQVPVPVAQAPTTPVQSRTIGQPQKPVTHVLVEEGTTDTPWEHIRLLSMKTMAESGGPPAQQFAQQLRDGLKATGFRNAADKCVNEWLKRHDWLDVDTVLQLDVETRDDEMRVASARNQDAVEPDSIEACFAKAFSGVSFPAEGQPGGIRRRLVYPIKLATR